MIKHILKNEFKYQFKMKKNILDLTAIAYEDLDKTDRSKYEYVLPNLVYERNLISNDEIGIIDLILML